MNKRSIFLQELGIQDWQAREAQAPAAASPLEPSFDTPIAHTPLEPTFTTPAVASAEPNNYNDQWLQLEAEVSGCTKCDLCHSRTQTVFGVGNPQADWMIVGEAPGAEEDKRGQPFVGQAGKLLDNVLASIQLSRAQHVFIANVLKCRPPGNRDPLPEEVASCLPYLQRQITLVAPKIILVFGRFAAQSVLNTSVAISKLRNQIHHITVNERAIPVVATYHPAYLLRSPAEKAKVWADLCLAREQFNALPHA